MYKKPLLSEKLIVLMDKKLKQEIDGYADWEGESTANLVRRFIKEGLKRAKRSNKE